MTRRPSAHAANAKDFLEFLDELYPGARAHFVATLPKDVLHAVLHSARTDWTPIALDAIYVMEIVRWLGPEKAQDAWRQFTSKRFIKTPAIRTLVEGAIRLFGLSVKSLVRRLPLGYQQSFRDFADVRVDLGDDVAIVTLDDVAVRGAQFDAYAVLFHGVFLGLYDIAGVRPRLDYQPDADARRIVARFSW